MKKQEKYAKKIRTIFWVKNGNDGDNIERSIPFEKKLTTFKKKCKKVVDKG